MEADHRDDSSTQEGWFVHFEIGSPPKGPFSPASILDMIAHGEIEPSTLVFHRDYKDGEIVWAERVPEFAAAFLKPAVVRKKSLKLWRTGLGVSIFLVVGGHIQCAVIQTDWQFERIDKYMASMLLLILSMLFVISMQLHIIIKKMK